MEIVERNDLDHDRILRMPWARRNACGQNQAESAAGKQSLDTHTHFYRFIVRSKAP
jgi:hypothetical protein